MVHTYYARQRHLTDTTQSRIRHLQFLQKHDESSDNPTLTDLTGDVASGSIIDLGVKLDKGELSTNVVNNKGSVLPSTGGAGRVAIYVIGAILVIGGGIVLVTKKRVR